MVFAAALSFCICFPFLCPCSCSHSVAVLLSCFRQVIVAVVMLQLSHAVVVVIVVLIICHECCVESVCYFLFSFCCNSKHVQFILIITKVCPATVWPSSEEDELMGWCWVESAVVHKELFNARAIVAKDCEECLLQTRANLMVVQMDAAEKAKNVAEKCRNVAGR